MLCCVGRWRFQSIPVLWRCRRYETSRCLSSTLLHLISPCLVHPKLLNPSLLSATSSVLPPCPHRAASHPPLHCSVPRPPGACPAALPRLVGGGPPHTNPHQTPAAGTRGSGSCNVATVYGGGRMPCLHRRRTGRRSEGEMLRVATRSFDVDRFSGCDLCSFGSEAVRCRRRR